MKIRTLIVFFGLFFSLSIFSQEKAEIKDEQIVKGKQIIEDARKAITTNKLISNLNSLQISTKRQSDYGEFVMVDTKEINISLPDKILSVYSTTKPFESKATSIWNGEKYKKLFENVTFDGQRSVRDVTNKKLNDNFLKMAKDDENREKMKKAMSIDPRERLNNDLWSDVFPFILIQPLEKQAEFKYIGKTKSADREANVVDTTTKSGRSIRLVFDSETKFLLLMIEKYQGFDGDYETKYYYSDRESVDNVLIPKKIKVEHRFTPTGKDTKVTYYYNDILEFKINPKFKSNLFDIN